MLFFGYCYLNNKNFYIWLGSSQSKISRVKAFGLYKRPGLSSFFNTTFP
jgi:hypothetical protein